MVCPLSKECSPLRCFSEMRLLPLSTCEPCNTI
jgi:hypothetical protein